MTRQVTRWSGAVAGALLLVTTGIGTGSRTMLLAAVIPLGYLAFGALSGARPPAADLDVSRTITPSPAPPDRPVSVTLTVRNAGDRILPDVRIVDGVPEKLAVVDGTPRGVATLRPGEHVEIEYTLVSRRGAYRFEPTLARTRNVSATAAATDRIDPAGDDRLVGRLDADAPPLYERARRRAGVVATDDPGRGLEFHSTREYRRGDPADRIDWRHYAKRGDLATVNYREQRSAAVILVVDARQPCHAVPAPGRSSGAELAAYGATRALAELLRAGHDVGAAVLGRAQPDGTGVHWIPPGTGRDHRAIVIQAFEAASEHRPGDEAPGTTDAHVRQIARRAPPGSQLVLFSSLLDDPPVRAAETWSTHDVATSVFSPDVLADNTVSGQYEQVRRRTRLARCQSAGVRTVDWRRGTPLPVALEYAFSAARARGRPDGSIPGGTEA